MTNVKMKDLKEKMVNVKNDSWYSIKDYTVNSEGFLATVLADNGTWYNVKNIAKLI